MINELHNIRTNIFNLKIEIFIIFLLYQIGAATIYSVVGPVFYVIMLSAWTIALGYHILTLLDEIKTLKEFRRLILLKTKGIIK